MESRLYEWGQHVAAAGCAVLLAAGLGFACAGGLSLLNRVTGATPEPTYEAAPAVDSGSR